MDCILNEAQVPRLGSGHGSGNAPSGTNRRQMRQFEPEIDNSDSFAHKDYALAIFEARRDRVLIVLILLITLIDDHKVQPWANCAEILEGTK